MAWRVGLLGGSRADRVDRVDRAAETGDAVDCFEERVPRFVGEDILRVCEGNGGGRDGWCVSVEEIQRREQKAFPGHETRLTR